MENSFRRSCQEVHSVREQKQVPFPKNAFWERVYLPCGAFQTDDYLSLTASSSAFGTESPATAKALFSSFTSVYS